MHERRLQVFKKILSDRQMSDVAFVDEAAGWSRDLTRMRARGPGDVENAMRAIERDYGVDYWTQWQLRYRRSRIRDIGVSIYMRLREAHRAECERQARKLMRDAERTKATCGATPAVVAALEALDRPGDGGEQAEI
jgi:hypothetical protein